MRNSGDQSLINQQLVSFIDESVTRTTQVVDVETTQLKYLVKQVSKNHSKR